ncbi:MAG: T9SS type A sorting domain-containing protein [Flavobacteriales bacterium]|nr:T9SS type A sorting domain-containing protein [Flavobacteriales bacterium]
MNPVLRSTMLLLSSGALLAQAQDVAGRLIYDRATPPNGAVWLNDGNGTDSLYFTNGNLVRVDQSGRFIFYMQNTPLGNEAFGGTWMRHDVADGSDHLLYSGGADYTVGYDMLETDSALVVSYSCAIYRTHFDGAQSTVITQQSCYDDGPALRQADSMIVFHNTQAQMYLMHMDGSGRTTVPNTQSRDVWPTWSPDGQWILFGRLDDNYEGFRNYYKIKPNGDSLTVLTPYDPMDTAHFTSNAVWSSDGLAIICAGPRNGQNGLIAYMADGSFAHMPLYTVPGDPIHFISGMADITVVDGVTDPAPTAGPRCWPTPADATVHLSWDRSGPCDLVLYDEQGRTVQQNTVTGPMADVDVQALPPGMYLARLRSTDGRWTGAARVLKQ